MQVDFIPYMDEIAELIGCKPKVKEVWREFMFGVRALKEAIDTLFASSRGFIN
jgi:hypothetical protein